MNTYTQCNAFPLFKWWCLHLFGISGDDPFLGCFISSSHTIQMDVMKSTKFNRTTVPSPYKIERKKIKLCVFDALCVVDSTGNSIYISTITTATVNANSLITTHHRLRRHCNSISFRFFRLAYTTVCEHYLRLRLPQSQHRTSNISRTYSLNLFFGLPFTLLGCQNEISKFHIHFNE